MLCYADYVSRNAGTKGMIMYTKRGYPATDKQLAFLRSLAAQRVASSLGNTADERLAGVNRWISDARPDGAEVSYRIDWMLKQPKDSARVPVTTVPARSTEPLVPGVYELRGTGEIFVIKRTKDKVRLYAKRLVELPNSNRLTESGRVVEFDFEYAPGAIKRIKLSDKMTLARAAELLIRYERCLDCGRRLKVAASVKRGVGPVCAKNYAL